MPVPTRPRRASCRPPLAVDVLPGLAVVVIIGLAGGVSLGPENPIVAVNVALAVWLGRRYADGRPGAAVGRVRRRRHDRRDVRHARSAPRWCSTESPPRPTDRASGTACSRRVVAAAAGALTMAAFGQPVLAVSTSPPYPGAGWPDLISATGHRHRRGARWAWRRVRLPARPRRVPALRHPLPRSRRRPPARRPRCHRRAHHLVQGPRRDEGARPPTHDRPAGSW